MSSVSPSLKTSKINRLRSTTIIAIIIIHRHHNYYYYRISRYCRYCLSRFKRTFPHFMTVPFADAPQPVRHASDSIVISGLAFGCRSFPFQCVK